MEIARMIRGRSRESAAVDRLVRLWQDGAYEELEAGARELQAQAGRLRGREQRLVWEQCARAMATGAACALGRGARVLPELESLAAELRQTPGTAAQQLSLMVRSNRMVVLAEAGRHVEAEAEGLDILRGVTRLKHLAPVWDIELSVLDNLVAVLCVQGRHEEAEAIARGNLPRAEGASLAALHCGLVRSLSGQGRYEEALAEARRYTPPRVRAHSGGLDLATAEALHGLGRRDEAETVARRAVSDCERFLHPEHPRIPRARALLAEITGEDPESR
ncbi:tetratricopeptide repeat protein [Streptomyces sp. NPDC020489]|uniref:tetratricopeptide repeat protein n=1 Tax=Streptomyces sp. NPDC020489 TaxID=3365077 RepID=UPI0037B19222